MVVLCPEILVVEMSQELKHFSCLDLLQQILVSLHYFMQGKEEEEQARNLERCALKAAKLQHGKLKALHT